MFEQLFRALSDFTAALPPALQWLAVWSDIGFSDSGWRLISGYCLVVLSPFGVDLIGSLVIESRVETFVIVS